VHRSGYLALITVVLPVSGLFRFSPEPASIHRRERCLAAGMDGYIAKPITARELIELLEKFSDAAQEKASPV
jgi:hypothetical protein